ncbi:MAG TPA: SDR family oxidoreductase [Ignavibacteriales bacterium]|nr:SDR family oxidoreductase [Ignavibacteriales bacterium]
MKNILVTGATGHLGSAALGFLLNKVPAAKLAGLARSADKAAEQKAKGIDIRAGDYFDYSSLVQAFAGVEKLALISSSEMKDRSVQQINAVNAAKEAGVKHIIYTSMTNPSHDSHFEAGPSHFDTEEAIKNSGLIYTILRNGLYLDFIPMFIGGVPQSGAFYFPAGNGEANFAARVDLAEALANVLASNGHENKIYDLTIDPPLSFNEIAAAFSDLLGRRIEYVDIPQEAFQKELAAHSVPQGVITMMAGLAEGIKLNELRAPSNDLEKILGRKPAGVREAVKGLLAHAEVAK